MSREDRDWHRFRRDDGHYAPSSEAGPVVHPSPPSTEISGKCGWFYDLYDVNDHSPRLWVVDEMC